MSGRRPPEESETEFSAAQQAQQGNPIIESHELDCNDELEFLYSNHMCRPPFEAMSCACNDRLSVLYTSYLPASLEKDRPAHGTNSYPVLDFNQMFDRSRFGLGGAFSSRFRPTEKINHEDYRRDIPLVNGSVHSSQPPRDANRPPSRGIPTLNGTDPAPAANGTLAGYTLPLVPSPYSIPDLGGRKDSSRRVS